MTRAAEPAIAGPAAGPEAAGRQPVLDGVRAVSILAVTHPPKATQAKAMTSFTGSYAYVAAARIALFITTEDKTDRRLMLCVKNNIGPTPTGKGYFIEPKTVTNNIIAPHVLWDDAPVNMTADQAIAAAAAAQRDGGEVARAKEML